MSQPDETQQGKRKYINWKAQLYTHEAYSFCVIRDLLLKTQDHRCKHA
jgi:hypothetical protein